VAGWATLPPAGAGGRDEVDARLGPLGSGDSHLDEGVGHLIDLSNGLQACGVDLVVLDQGIDTSTAVGRMFFQILGAIAEFEHALIRSYVGRGR